MKLDSEKGIIHHFVLDCQVRQTSSQAMISYYRMACRCRGRVEYREN